MFANRSFRPLAAALVALCLSALPAVAQGTITGSVVDATNGLNVTGALIRTGRVFGRGTIAQQAEGIALWTCGDSSGYWVTTDQGPVVNTFNLFDRQTLAHVGAFRGAVTNTTDGVALSQRAVGPYTAGMFFTAHFDAAISAFDWRDIASATGALASCASP